MCEENNVGIFERKRLELKLIALQALNKSKSPSPTHSTKHRSSTNGHHTHRSSKHYRTDSNHSHFSATAHGITDDGYTNNGQLRARQPSIRIVVSEAEQNKLTEMKVKKKVIQHKIHQIKHNMNVLTEEQHRLEKQIDAHFDDFILFLQRRRNNIKYEQNEITTKQANSMEKYVQALSKQTKQISDAQAKCEKYLEQRTMSTSQRKAKVLKVANKALENRSDAKIIIPTIKRKKKKSQNEKTYFVTLELDEKQIKKVWFDFVFFCFYALDFFAQYIESIGQVRRVLVK